MVSAAQVNGGCLLHYESLDFELSKGELQVSLSGSCINLYYLKATPKGNIAVQTSMFDQDDQSLLDSVLLSQWEDRLWKGFLGYDVTACETKIVDGEKQFIAQLNDKLSSSSIKEFENKILKPLGCVKSNVLQKYPEEILLCISEGENGKSKLVHSTNLPKDSILVIAAVNPVEYGHVFLVPHAIDEMPFFWDRKTLEMITRIAGEINNRSFLVSFDYDPSSTSDQMYFQASYFPNPFPVELFPSVPLCSGLCMTAISISEVVDYPLKSLVIASGNQHVLVNFAAELCSTMHDLKSAFSLLIANCGQKLYLFPQVQNLLMGCHISAWECGGFFIYRTEFCYDNATEADILARMASASLDGCSFEDLKHRCCSIAAKYAD